MENSKNKKNVLILLALVLLGAGVYYFYFRTVPDTSLDVVANGQVNIKEIETSATRFLSALNQLEAIKLDGKFFSNSAYLKLVSFSVPVSPQSAGRDNPFAPVSGLPVQKNISR